jgi:putative inorganic carbon (hco3(-)) transporter
MVGKSFLGHVSWLPIFLVFLAIGLGIVLGLGVAVLDNPIYVVAALIGGIVALVCVLNGEVGLYILVAITYLRLSDVLVSVYGAPSIAKPFVALMIGVVILRWWFYDTPPRGAFKAFLLILAYGLVISLSIFHASDVLAVQEALDDFWRNAVIAILIVMLLHDGRTLRNVVWGLILIGIFMGSISVWQYLTGTFENEYWGFGIADIQNIAGASSGYRIAGPLGDPNVYAQIMLVIIPLAFIRFLEEKNLLLKAIALFGTLVATLTVVFTFSRGAFLALVLMVMLMFYFHPPKPREFLISVFVFFMFIPLVPVEYKERMLTLDNLAGGNSYAAEGEVSFRGRASEYQAAWMMFADRPIWGVGVQNYNTYYQKYSRQIGLDPRSEARSAHSLYLEVAAELGLAGLGVLGAVLLAAFRSIARAWKQLSKAGDKYHSELVLSVGIGISGYLLAAIFVHDAYPRYFWLLIGIALAVTEVARQETIHKFNSDISHGNPEDNV